MECREDRANTNTSTIDHLMDSVPSVVTAPSSATGAPTTDNVEAETPPATPRILGQTTGSTRRPAPRSDSSLSNSPQSKKIKATPAKTPRPGSSGNVAREQESRDFLARDSGDQRDHTVLYRRSLDDIAGFYDEEMQPPTTPVASYDRQRSISSSSPSDFSASSRGRDGSISPGTPYVPEVPPAPPSTPASEFKSTLSSSQLEGLLTPLPYGSAVRNAAQLEYQQQLADGAVTPAPTKPASNRTAPNQLSRTGQLIDDFTDWVVGDRYKMVRMLGRGSYGEVAQAFDLYQGNASVAIKRIQSPFEQEVDAVRLFREIHILRRLKGHECVIDLLDVIQPPTDNLNDFHDLYLVFECK